MLLLGYNQTDAAGIGRSLVFGWPVLGVQVALADRSRLSWLVGVPEEGPSPDHEQIARVCDCRAAHRTAFWFGVVNECSPDSVIENELRFFNSDPPAAI